MADSANPSTQAARRPLQRRIGRALVLLAVGVIAATSLAQWFNWGLAEAARRMAGVDVPLVTAACRIARLADRCGQAQRQWELAGVDAGARRAAVSNWDKACRQIHDLLAAPPRDLAEADRAAWSDLQRQFHSCRETLGRMAGHAETSGLVTAAPEARLSRDRIEALQAQADALTRSESARVEAGRMDLEQIAATQVRLINAGGVIALTLCFLLGLTLRRWIFTRIDRLSESIARLNARQTEHLECDGDDELGMLGSRLEEGAAAVVEAWAEVDRVRLSLQQAGSGQQHLLAGLCEEARRLLDTTAMHLQNLCGKCHGSERTRNLRTAISQLLETIDDIRDLTQSEAGDAPRKPGRCLPGQLLAELTYLLKPQADAKGLSLTVAGPPDSGSVLHTDAVRLRRALSNVLAVMIADGGPGVIRLQGQEQRGADGAGRFRFVVSGPAAPANSAPNPGGDAAPASMSALRVAVSRRLMESLGGQLEPLTADGNRGLPPGMPHGFVLTVSDGGKAPGAAPAIPAAAPAARAEAAVSPPRPVGDKLRGRILLAEDGPENQRFIKRLLTAAGAEVSVASNGQEVIELVLGPATAGHAGGSAAAGLPAFDVILMDMDMPLVAGLEATRRLRLEGCDTPIVAITALSERYSEQECRTAGCDYFLTKPLDSDGLLDIVRQAAAKEQVSR